jgi:uncharacterized Tic20 family protein
MSNAEAKTLSIIAHLAGLFSSLLISVLVPIAVLLLSDNMVARANARESLNFQINLFIWAVIAVVLCFILIGFVLLAVCWYCSASSCQSLRLYAAPPMKIWCTSIPSASASSASLAHSRSNFEL